MVLEETEKNEVSIPTTPEIQDGKDGEEPSKAQDSHFRSFVRIFQYGNRTDYILEAIGIVAAIGSGVALSLTNVVIGQLLTTFSKSDFSDIGRNSRTLSLYFVYIGIARLVLTYIYSSLFTFVAYRLCRNIRERFLRAALSMHIGYFDKGKSGSISMQATTNGLRIQSGIAEKLGLLVQASATFVAEFVIAFVYHWKLTLIIIGIVPVVLIVVGGASIIEAACETSILQVYAQAGAYAENILAGIRTVKAFNLRPRVMSKYTSYLDDAFDLGKKKSILYGILFGGENFVIYCGMALAFWQGIARLASGEIPDIGTVFIVLFAVIIAASTILQIAPHSIAFTHAASAAAELFDLIDQVSEIDPFNESGEKPSEVHGDIDIRDIKFSYPTRPDVPVLDDFSLRIPAGKVTALVGASGSGKSTIIGLLERWYDPAAGSILLDGKDIKSLNLTWLRTNIRLVQQEPVLFNGTVFENIANGLVGTSWEDKSVEIQRERVEEAAKLAFAHDFIMNLPQGYDTPVGERGCLLSGGQKQRVAIARSIISNPRILLLDEATSALDPHAEGIVQQALDRASKDRTTIVIAHKLATIRNADNIVVMSKGRIVEQGRHEDLVSRGGAYAALVKAQDLSSTTAESDSGASDGKSIGEEEGAVVEHTYSITRYATLEAQNLAALKDREDLNLYQRSGLIKNIVKLVRNTLELKFWYLLLLFSCVLGAAVFPGQALLLANAIDIAGVDNMVERGNFVALMFFILAIGCLIAYFVLGWASNVIAQTLSKKMRRGILDSILRQDLQFFDRPENTVGSLTSRLASHPQAILELMGFNISLVVICAINIIASSILAIIVSWKLGLVGVLVGIPPIAFAGYGRIRLEERMNAVSNAQFSASASTVSESVMAIRTVSSLAIENRVLQRYTDALDVAIRKTSRSMFNTMIWFSFTQAIEYFILALGFWWGSKLISQGDINLYQFIVSFMGVYFSAQASGQLFSYSSSFSKGNDAANYYFWLSGLQATIRETDENRGIGPSNNCSSYDFDKVQFSYPLAPDTRVLKGVTLSIQPNQFVAFVGASGCGKSTMVSLLERFYDPTSGRIIVDTAQLTSINPLLYRRRLALVQQEPTLFPGSIRENIAHGIDTDASDTVPEAEIEAACRAANAWDFISSLPEGLNTPCGVGGSQLSGGQRQRIAIARALVRNPNVILLDEATSALDTESERIIQNALTEAAAVGDRITIAVAHRLSTVRNADQIFVFHAGRIVEAGTHEELLEQGGMYARMCEAQTLDRGV
ncbi:P-loop containing nucleoside triphosphate hydrolase protein [Hypoxylon sp. NC0597]|nr:P-loop containing nucleoside triphosphate hydrolase protein [Hypoxylon sp. NC0597]